MSESAMRMNGPFSSEAFAKLDVNRMSVPELARGIRKGDKACMIRMYTLLHDDLLAIARKTIESARQAELIVRKTFSEVLNNYENIDPDLFELNLIQVLDENTRKEDIYNTYTIKTIRNNNETLVESLKARAVPAKLETKTEESAVSLTAFADAAALESDVPLTDYADAAEDTSVIAEEKKHASKTLSIPLILGSAAAIATAGVAHAAYQHEEARKRDLSYTQMMDALGISFVKDEAGHEVSEFEYTPGALKNVDELVADHSGTLATNTDALDLSKTGSFLVNYTLSNTDSYGQQGYTSVQRNYVVKDTQMPVIHMAVDSVSIQEGEGFDPLSVVSQVTDPADGELMRVDAAPEALVDDASGRMYETGWYTVTSNVDVNTPGSYNVTVHAVDNHGNVSDANVPVTVNAKPRYRTVSVNTSENAAWIYNFLTGSGFTKAATAGILANIQIESSFNPTAGSSYYGLCQWGGGRASNLVAFCAANGYSSDSVEGQIRFMISEMGGGLISEMNACEDSANGAAQAGYIFRTKFERSAGLNNVESIAASFYNAY